jgi:hypothetical protein
MYVLVRASTSHVSDFTGLRFGNSEDITTTTTAANHQKEKPEEKTMAPGRASQSDSN